MNEDAVMGESLLGQIGDMAELPVRCDGLEVSPMYGGRFRSESVYAGNVETEE